MSSDELNCPGFGLSKVLQNSMKFFPTTKDRYEVLWVGGLFEFLSTFNNRGVPRYWPSLLHELVQGTPILIHKRKSPRKKINKFDKPFIKKCKIPQKFPHC